MNDGEKNAFTVSDEKGTVYVEISSPEGGYVAIAMFAQPGTPLFLANLTREEWTWCHSIKESPEAAELLLDLLMQKEERRELKKSPIKETDRARIMFTLEMQFA